MNIRQSFASMMGASFEKKYGIKPSPENFIGKYSATFNDSVSYETVRKWLKGLNTPNFERVCAIAIWLNMDVNDFLKNAKKFKH